MDCKADPKGMYKRLQQLGCILIPETMASLWNGSKKVSDELPNYTINQLRYDLRTVKAHGLVERNGRQYSYIILTEKGIRVEAMFTLFHKRLFGPLANSLFHHQPSNLIVPNRKLEKAYHQTDDYIEKITELLAA